MVHRQLKKGGPGEDSGSGHKQLGLTIGQNINGKRFERQEKTPNAQIEGIFLSENLINNHITSSSDINKRII